MSPRVPLPLLTHAAATRPTYAGDGLLVTSRWISCLPMNGQRFGWLNSVSSAIFRLSCADVFAGIVTLRKALVPVSWNCGYGCIGRRMRSA